MIIALLVHGYEKGTVSQETDAVNSDDHLPRSLRYLARSYEITMID